ncbi:MAG TPA: endonuclease domain-containing protein [Steroidobacteraceae bacterium]|nr:endonuclease domain-containing protein [Steroidobacteraceae bacterium]
MRHPLTQRRATALRKKTTDAEQRLWYHLRRRQLSGVRFRRQVPIGPFIADFACLEASLIVEVDGGQHHDNPKDARRDVYLQSHGYRILRFWDNDVLRETDAVLEVIRRSLEGMPPSCPSPASGGRDVVP